MSKSINGYIIEEDLKTKTSSSVFWKAEKGRTKYFLKRFDNPKRPSDRVSEAVRKQKNEACDTFARERRKVLYALKACVGSSIIAPVEFFEFENRFYQATEWRKIQAKSLEEIRAFPSEQKEFLFKTAALNLKVIHSKGLIHLDIKPDNLPVSVNEVNGKLVCTLIDFDCSYFENALPTPELTPATYPYMSPELFSYMTKNPKYGNVITTKNDVFALAIVFHEYWTGRKFIFKGSDDKTNARYLYQAVDNNERIDVAPGVPDWLDALLHWMIQRKPEDRPTMAQVLEALKDHSKIPGQKPIPPVPSDEDNEEKKRIEEEKRRKEIERQEEEKRRREEEHRKEIERQEEEKRRREEEYRKEIERQEALKRQKAQLTSGFAKGPRFPEDAASFEVLPNGNIKIFSKNGSKSVYRQAVALSKGWIVKI